MWERCPWDRGQGCIGLSLRVNVPRLERPRTEPKARVARVSAPKAPRAARARLAPEEKRRRDRAATMRWAARKRAERRESIEPQTCEQCGEQFMIQGSRPLTRSRFCGRSCAVKWWNLEKGRRRRARLAA
jgi:formylmethanofuran dehydrogenase subunit E